MRARQWRQGLTIGVLLVVVAWLSYLIWNLGEKALVAVSEEKQIKAQYTELEARRTSLQANLDNLGTARGQDAAIRQAFGVAKPGEEVIVIVPPVAASTTPPESWWQKVLDWF